MPEQSALKHVKDGGTLDIISLVKGYRRTPAEYEGKRLTVKGGRVSKVMRIILEGEEVFMLVLLSEPVRDSSGRSTELHINCCYPLSAGDRLAKLKQGQNFTASGTWKHGRLVNCVWSSPNAHRQDNPHKKHGREDDYIRKTMAIITVIAAVAAFLKFLIEG